jgi:hypothetical protein
VQKLTSMEADFEAWCNRLLDVEVEVCSTPLYTPILARRRDLKHKLTWNALARIL